MLDHWTARTVLDQATSDCKGIIDRAMDITKLPTLDLRNRDANLGRTAIKKNCWNRWNRSKIPDLDVYNIYIYLFQYFTHQ